MSNRYSHNLKIFSRRFSLNRRYKYLCIWEKHMSGPMRHPGTKEYKSQINRTGVSCQMWNILHEPSAQRRVRICYENYDNIIPSIKSKQPIFSHLCAVARTISPGNHDFQRSKPCRPISVFLPDPSFFLVKHWGLVQQ